MQYYCFIKLCFNNAFIEIQFMRNYIPELLNSRMQDRIDSTADELKPGIFFIIIADLKSFKSKT